MRVLNTKDSDFKNNFEILLQRGQVDMQGVSNIVENLINEIKQNGDEAIIKHIAKFDKWNVEKIDDIKISPKDMKKAYKSINPKLKKALKVAYERIYSYHEKQMPHSWQTYEKDGSILGQKISPVCKAGLYIPGGKAAYPSSVLMNAIPAIVAGVEEIIVCTPTPLNEINPLVLAALHLCKIKKAYKVGGASAIAAMAYGTKSIPKVDVITGPGNIYVATAKKMVFGEVNIDMIAGPSEIGIIADESANIAYLSMDLLSQAEHDEMASSILITHDENLALRVKEKIFEDLQNLNRKEIATKSLNSKAAIIITKSLSQSIKLMNEIAPEHLELMIKNPFESLALIKNAGAIFLGENTPEAIGDYLAGPNHTLPTGGSAKFFSPLGVEHFIKKSSIISMSKKAILNLNDKCAILAKTEGLDAHEKSVKLRK